MAVVAAAMIGTIAVDRVVADGMEIPVFARMEDGRNPRSVRTLWVPETDVGMRQDEETVCYWLINYWLFSNIQL